MSSTQCVVLFLEVGRVKTWTFSWIYVRSIRNPFPETEKMTVPCHSDYCGRNLSKFCIRAGKLGEETLLLTAHTMRFWQKAAYKSLQRSLFQQTWLQERTTLKCLILFLNVTTGLWFILAQLICCLLHSKRLLLMFLEISVWLHCYLFFYTKIRTLYWHMVSLLV